MSNYNNRNRYRKSSNAATIVAVILGILLIASVTLGLGNHFGGWFESDETEIVDTDDSTSVEDSSSDLVVEDSGSGE